MTDKEAMDLFDQLSPENQDEMIELLRAIIDNRDSTPVPEPEGGC